LSLNDIRGPGVVGASFEFVDSFFWTTSFAGDGDSRGFSRGGDGDGDGDNEGVLRMLR